LILIETEDATNTVKEKIDDILFGVAPTGDDEKCIEIEYFEANKDECIALGYLDCSTVGRKQTGGAKTRDDCGGCTETAEDGTPYEIEQTTGACEDPTTGDPALTEEEQDCIDKGRIFENGECTDNCDNPDYVVDPVDGSCGPRDITKNPEEICQEKGLTYDPNPNNPDRDNDGCVSTVIVDPKCDDPNAQNYGELGECGECKENFKKDPNTGKCIAGDGTTTDVYKPDCENDLRPTGPVTFDLIEKQGIWDRKCGGGTGSGGNGEDQCTGGKVSVNGECVCPDGTTEVNGQCVSGPRDTSTKVYKSAYCKTRGPEGGTLVTTYTDDTQEESFSEVCKASGGDTTIGGGYKCDDPNATVREDGSCGPCKAGYVFNGALERCVQESVTNPCNDPIYAAENPQECVTVPECIDCTCAEYAAANPEECGTTPPPPPPSGGSGGTGGTGGGMFSVDAGFELQGDPQLLTKMQFPIENFLQQYVEGMGDQNTSITSLFEGLV
jgi:hypothetical protein